MAESEIKKFFKGDVAVDEETLVKYSKDYSIFQIKPAAVVFPRDAADLKNLVKFVKEKKRAGENISLTARSAGTDMSGGPLTDSIVIVFERYFNKIKKITDTYAIVQPGVYFRDLEKELNKKNLLYPPYPASKDICAVGGMIANNSGGEKTLAYGKTEDYVEEIKMVTADGREDTFKPTDIKKIKDSRLRRLFDLVVKNEKLIKDSKPTVHKNSAGYALWNIWDGKLFNPVKLIVGSQGTLGLITEVKLRLVPKRRYSKLAVLFLPSLENLAGVILKALEFKPESLESYDDKTFIVALKYLPSLIKLMGGNFFKLFFQFLPELKMVLVGGIPKLVVLAEFASDDEKQLAEVAASFVREMSKQSLRCRLVESSLEREKYLTVRRQSFNLLHGHIINREAASFIDDIIVRPEYLPEVLPKLNKILDRYKDKMIYTIAGHPGDGNFHIIPLIDLKDPATRVLIPKIMDEVYDLVLLYGGSITAEHNDGLLRTPYLEKMYGRQMVKLFKEVKKIFDPDNIFNPHKKVNGSLDYSFKYLKD